MLTFLGTLIAALIGAMLAPYFSHLLTANKIKREERLKNLEKAYVLANRMYGHAYLFVINIAILSNIQRITLTPDSLLKPQEPEPYTELLVLLDYHLGSSKDFVEKVTDISNSFADAWGKCIEAIQKPEKFVELYPLGVQKSLQTLVKLKPLSLEIIDWIKIQKKETESSGFYNSKFWSSIKAWYNKQQ